MALYPNLNCKDPVWNRLWRDVRVRRALSLAVNRREIVIPDVERLAGCV